MLTQLYDSTDRLAEVKNGAATVATYLHNAQGQRVAKTVGAAVWDATYRPFGEATVTGALTFNLRFPGQYEDAETGLHYNTFRDYDTSTGRYIQSDPIAVRGTVYLTKANRAVRA